MSTREKDDTKPHAFRVVGFSSLVHETDGHPLTDRAEVEANLAAHATIKQWATALHDADDADPHVQGCARSDKPLTLEKWAQYIGVSENVLQVLRAPNNVKNSAFLERVYYLTHEGQPDKHTYSRDSIHVNTEWEPSWRADLDDYIAKRTAGTNRRGRSIVNQVRLEGLSIHEARNKGAVNVQGLRAARAEYLRSEVAVQLVPSWHDNVYVAGDDEVAARALATLLARGEAERSKTRVFELTKARGFDEYDGEGIILVNSGEITYEYREDNWVAASVREMIRRMPVDGLVQTKRYGMTRLIHKTVICYGPSKDSRTDSSAYYRMTENNSLPDSDADEAFPLRAIINADGWYVVQASEYFKTGDPKVLREWSHLFKQRFDLFESRKLAMVLPRTDREQVEAAVTQRIVEPVITARNELQAQVARRNEGATVGSVLAELGIPAVDDIQST